MDFNQELKLVTGQYLAPIEWDYILCGNSGSLFCADMRQGNI